MVRRMFCQMFRSSSSAVYSMSMSWSTSMFMSMSNQEEDEDVLADVSEQQRGRGWCAAKFFQHFPLLLIFEGQPTIPNQPGLAFNFPPKCIQ